MEADTFPLLKWWDEGSLRGEDGMTKQQQRKSCRSQKMWLEESKRMIISSECTMPTPIKYFGILGISLANTFLCKHNCRLDYAHWQIARNLIQISQWLWCWSFLLAISSDQNSPLSNTLVCDQIPANLMPFSYVLYISMLTNLIKIEYMVNIEGFHGSHLTSNLASLHAMNKTAKQPSGTLV